MPQCIAGESGFERLQFEKTNAAAAADDDPVNQVNLDAHLESRQTFRINLSFPKSGNWNWVESTRFRPFKADYTLSEGPSWNELTHGKLEFQVLIQKRRTRNFLSIRPLDNSHGSTAMRLIDNLPLWLKCSAPSWRFFGPVTPTKNSQIDKFFRGSLI